MNPKSIIIWTVVIVAVAGLMVGLAYLGTRQTAPVEVVLKVPVSGSDLSKGPTDAKVTLVEYGDFQCPACGQYFPIVEQMTKDYSDRMRFVFRHYPLRSIHPNAQAAAQAAQAAAVQGKFWEYYRMLYEHQDDWAKLADPMATFTSYAKDLKLDTAKFASDMKSDATISKIQSDIDGGDASGVGGSTPRFYLNGKQIAGPTTVEAFEKLIDDALK